MTYQEFIKTQSHLSSVDLLEVMFKQYLLKRIDVYFQTFKGYLNKDLDKISLSELEVWEEEIRNVLNIKIVTRETL